MVFLFVFFIVIFLLLLSKIRIEINNLRFSSIKPKQINRNYKIVIKLCLFNKMPIIKISLTKIKLEKLNINKKIKNINLKVLEDKNRFEKNFWKAIKKIEITIKKIDLDVELGTENASFTSLLIPVFSTILAMIFRKKISNHEKQKFKITPIYRDKNIINIAISGIFEIKMIHIINIIYILNKKKGVNKHERASNRGSYDYSYE